MTKEFPAIILAADTELIMLSSMLLIRFMADISVICSTKALVFLKPDTVNIMALAANATTITTQISIICLEEFNLLFIYSPLYVYLQKTLQGTPIHPSILPYFRGKVNNKVCVTYSTGFLQLHCISSCIIYIGENLQLNKNKRAEIFSSATV